MLAFTENGIFNLSIANVIISIFLLSVTWFVVHTVRKAIFTSLWNVPGPLLCAFTNFPLYYYTYCGKYHEFTLALHKKYGDVVRVGVNQISLANVDELRRVMSTHNFPKGKSYERGLFWAPSTFSTTDPELNKLRRRQTGVVYSMPAMRAFEDAVIENGALSLIEAWDNNIAESREKSDQALVNYFYDFHGIAFDIIGALGFGCNFNIVRGGDWTIIDKIHKLTNLISIKSISPAIARLKWLFKDLYSALDYMMSLADNAQIQRRKDNKSGCQKPHVDILQKLIEAHDPSTGEKLSDTCMIAEILLLLVAGTDTSSNTLSYTLIHLLNHPNILERLQREIRQEFPDISTPIRFAEAREKLPYLTAVFLESMRVNSAVAGYLPRRVPDEGTVLLNKYQIPGGSEIILSLAACHHDKNVWERAEYFDPERFMDNKQGEIRAKNVLVFGHGVRMCLGRNLAWMELYTIMANILRKYKIELPSNSPYGPHRLSNNLDAVGEPENIPSKVFITSTPIDPRRNCRILISNANLS
ncbi:cytochrome P450 [Coemansia reversa NRRL 1564]|uniref:Cytochrome P450 n=1 Tax=Coemansia reversa (strain ATCC 12441 / NRRL 1564) TaxID=763665 RepID=A0A2G5BDR5_COERN|nr:cytochrome P450 [Coemansia reversa NRRL 1564]|eukprot:PIA17156.1 cytochrome P450 [Coemansia reversa NRRL 1564]